MEDPDGADEIAPARRPRLIRPRTEPLFKYDDLEVRRIFRFSPDSIRRLTDMLADTLTHPTNRSCSLSPIQQVCLALEFYATGSFQLSVGNHFGVHQSTICRTVWKVTRALIHSGHGFRLAADNRSKELWFEKFGFPNIIGATDCTHVEIQKPPATEFPESYMNRKSYYSVNVQIICDSNSKIISLIPNWPGSVHDSRIFKSSPSYEQHLTGELSGMLLGDAGYALTPFMMTPYLNPVIPQQRAYNTVHK